MDTKPRGETGDNGMLWLIVSKAAERLRRQRLILFVIEWHFWGDHDCKEELFWWSGVYSMQIGEG